MKTLFGLTLLLFSLSAVAEDPDPAALLTTKVGAAPADRSVDPAEAGRAVIQLEAATDDTNATIKTGWDISSSSAGRGKFKTFTLAASAPLSKSGATSIVSPTGFPNAFTLSAKYTSYSVVLRASSPRADQICDDARERANVKALAELIKIGKDFGLSDEDAIAFARKKKDDDRRTELQAMAMKMGKTKDEAEALAETRLKGEKEAAEKECDSDLVNKHAPELLDEYEAQYWDDSKTHRIWGFSGTIGHREYKYLQADLSEGSERKTPRGASVFMAFIPPRMDALFTLGAEHRQKYEDADSQTLCPQDPSATQLQCKSGPFGVPKDVTENLAFVEIRREFADRAISLKVAYDFEAENFSADLPIYLIKNADGGLAGGVRVGWKETVGVQLSVFVTGGFSIFP